MAKRAKKDSDISFITPVEAERVDARPEIADDQTLPGWLVTVRGSLPNVLAGLVIKKGPIRASSHEAAIARFLLELGEQFKKPSFLDVAFCEAEEMRVQIAPMLPLKEQT